MVNIITGLKLTEIKHIMKQFLILFITASFFFLSSVSAAPKATSGAKKYGPIKAGQTLWGIAYKTRPRGISRLHMMKALHKLNPTAFEKGNINLLKKGATLHLPTSKKMVRKILAGGKVQIAEEDDSNKDLETLRNELASVKDELAQSKETLKGLNEQSEQLQQVQQTVTSLKQENKALKNEAGQIPAKAAEKLAAVTEQFKTAQSRIKKLEAEKVKLQEQASKETLEDQQSTRETLATVTEELKKSQELVKTLAEKNKQLQIDSIDPKLFEDAKQELATTQEQLEALKVQNQLLREQSANADISETERKENNRKFTDTIAALNSDIGQLRSRIKELEELEKLKDNHISELQKSLDHATNVIKEQAEVNKKMYARLNDLEKADEEKEQKQEDEVAAAAVTNSTPSDPTPPSGNTSGDSTTAGSTGANNPTIVNFADQSGTTGNEKNGVLAVSETIQHISPKFWLMLTLAGLLFVLALLWRVISGSDEPDAAI